MDERAFDATKAPAPCTQKDGGTVDPPRRRGQLLEKSRAFDHVLAGTFKADGLTVGQTKLQVEFVYLTERPSRLGYLLQEESLCLGVTSAMLQRAGKVENAQVGELSGRESATDLA